MPEMVDLPPRPVVTLEGCSNFRDLGGHAASAGGAVGFGRLFRSERLSNLTARDIGVLVGAVGLRTVIDLRRADEIEAEAPTRLGPDVRYVHASLNRPADQDGQAPAIVGSDLGEVYHWIATGAPEAVLTVFSTLADERSYPAIFHCAGGKDRTGIIAALVLGVLGVAEADIVADYGRTREHLDRVSAADRAAAFAFVDRAGMPRAVLEAHDESMRTFLARMRDSFGGIADFLAHCGVDVGMQADVDACLRVRP